MGMATQIGSACREKWPDSGHYFSKNTAPIIKVISAYLRVLAQGRALFRMATDMACKVYRVQSISYRMKSALPTAPIAYGLNGPSAPATVDNATHAGLHSSQRKFCPNKWGRLFRQPGSVAGFISCATSWSMPQTTSAAWSRP